MKNVRFNSASLGNLAKDVGAKFRLDCKNDAVLNVKNDAALDLVITKTPESIGELAPEKNLGARKTMGGQLRVPTGKLPSKESSTSKLTLPKLTRVLSGAALLHSVPAFPNLSKIDDAFNRLRLKFELQAEDQAFIELPPKTEPTADRPTPEPPIQVQEKPKARKSIYNPRMLTSSQSLNNISKHRLANLATPPQKFSHSFRPSDPSSKTFANITTRPRGGSYNLKPTNLNPRHQTSFTAAENRTANLRVKWNPDT